MSKETHSKWDKFFEILNNLSKIYPNQKQSIEEYLDHLIETNQIGIIFAPFYDIELYKKLSLADLFLLYSIIGEQLFVYDFRFINIYVDLNKKTIPIGVFLCEKTGCPFFLIPGVFGKTEPFFVSIFYLSNQQIHNPVIQIDKSISEYSYDNNHQLNTDEWIETLSNTLPFSRLLSEEQSIHLNNNVGITFEQTQYSGEGEEKRYKSRVTIRPKFLKNLFSTPKNTNTTEWWVHEKQTMA